jgi:hypothetical protein
MESVLLEMRSTLETLQGCARVNPSREASLAVTNLEQAVMWFERAPAKQVLEDAPNTAGECLKAQ